MEEEYCDIVSLLPLPGIEVLIFAAWYLGADFPSF